MGLNMTETTSVSAQIPVKHKENILVNTYSKVLLTH